MSLLVRPFPFHIYSGFPPIIHSRVPISSPVPTGRRALAGHETISLGVGLSSHSRSHAVSQCRTSTCMSMSMMQRVPGLGFTAAILFVCYLLCSCTGDGEGPERRVSVVRRGPWQHEVVEGVHPEAAITATFTNQINKNGSVVRIRLKFLLQVYKQHVLTRFLGFCLLLCTRKD